MNDEIEVLIDRIIAGTYTDADLAVLRRTLLVSGQGNVIQIGKYNIQIGEGQDIRIGDTVYPTMASLLKGYATEVQEQYLGYWSRNVRALTSDSRNIEECRPARQVLYTELTPISDDEGKKRKEIAASEVRKAEFRSGTATPEATTRSTVEADSQHPAKSQRRIREYFSLFEAVDTLCLQSGTAGFFLVGEGGAGKTLSLRYLAALQAKALRDTGDRVPIYLPLNTFTEGLKLQDFIRNGRSIEEDLPNHRELIAHLEWILDHQGVLLLFDGLNEITESPSREVSTQRLFLDTLQDFVGKHNVKFVVASRLTPIIAASDYPQVQIRPFDQFGRSEGLQLYAPEYAEQIDELLDTNPMLGELAGNAFRLRAVCQVYHPDSTLPSSPGALYRDWVRILGQREVEQRAQPVGHWPAITEWHKGLCHLAEILTDTGVTSLEPGTRVELPVSEELIDFSRNAGFLQRDVTQIAFTHQELQDYFAAEWLFSTVEDVEAHGSNFESRAIKPEWQDAFYLSAGIVPTHRLDAWIMAIAAVEPFLAGRCLGQRPLDASLQTRQMVSDQLGEILRVALSRGDGDTAGQAFSALSETRCAESLPALASPELQRVLDFPSQPDVETETWYYAAIAKIDTPAAAGLIIEAFEKARASGLRNREQYTPFLLALAGMTNERARFFATRCVQDVAVYPSALIAVSSARLREAGPALKQLIHGISTYNKEDIPLIASAVLGSGAVELIPDLLSRVNWPIITETLLELGAGQQILDRYVEWQRHLLWRSTRRADLELFDCLPWDETGQHLADLWFWLDRYVGQEAAENLVGLLLNCVANASTYRKRLEAVSALVYLARYESLPLLRMLDSGIKTLPVAEEKGWGSHDNSEDERNALLEFIKKAIEYLETPAGLSASTRSLDAFSLSLRYAWKKLDGEDIPKQANRLLEQAYLDPDKMTRFAIMSLEHRDFAQRALALTFLADAGWSLTGTVLVQHLLREYQQQRSRDGHGPFEVWTLANKIIRHAGRGAKQRQEILNLVAPLAFEPDQGLRVLAIEILADLRASESCERLLSYLNDRTWSTAYVVVDAIARMDPPDSICKRLASQLESAAADERFFAVLALGSIARSRYMPLVLRLAQDPSLHVQRAVAWALSCFGDSSPGVACCLQAMLSSPSDRVRLEAARTIGVLRLGSLSGQLTRLLRDPNLRVVEWAVWALGELKARNAVPPLLTLMDDFDKDFWDFFYVSASFEFRPELRIVSTTLVSLAKIGEAAVIAGVEKLSHRGKDLKTLVTGQIAGRSWKPPRRKPDRIDSPQTYDEHEQVETCSASLTNERLYQRACRAALPAERAAAFARLAELKHWNDRPEPRDEIEPCAEVRRQIHKAWLMNTTEPHRAFSDNPILDLQNALELQDTRPDIVTHIPSPDPCTTNTALSIAEMAPDEYDLDGMIDAWLDLAEQGALDEDGLTALCRLARKKDLSRAVWAWRRHQRFGRSNLSAYALAKKRAWSIAADMANLLGKEKDLREAAQAIQVLCEMGIYQAAPKTKAVLNPVDTSDSLQRELADALVQVELMEAPPLSLPKWPMDDESDRYNVARYMLANLLCEIDSPKARDAWVDLQPHLLGYYDTDRDLLGRGLRRWGVEGARKLLISLGASSHEGFIQGLGQAMQATAKEQEEVERHLWTGQTAVARFLRAQSDEAFEKWLSDDSWAPRLIGVCALIGRRSPILMSRLQILLADKDERVILTLLESAYGGSLAVLAEAIRYPSGELPAQLDTECELLNLLSNAVKWRMTDTPRERTAAFIQSLMILGAARFAPEIRQLVDSQDSEIASEAIRSLAMLGDASAAPLIAAHLDSENPIVLTAALEAVAMLAYVEATPHISSHLDHGSWEVQNAAVAACGMLEIHEAIPKLQARLAHLRQERESSQATKNVDTSALQEPGKIDTSLEIQGAASSPSPMAPSAPLPEIAPSCDQQESFAIPLVVPSEPEPAAPGSDVTEAIDLPPPPPEATPASTGNDEPSKSASVQSRSSHTFDDNAERDYRLETALALTENSLCMVGAWPRFHLGGPFYDESMPFGEGLVAFSLLTRLMFESEFLGMKPAWDLQYPLETRELPAISLIRHMIDLDLRHTPWMSQRAKEVFAASARLGDAVWAGLDRKLRLPHTAQNPSSLFPRLLESLGVPQEPEAAAEAWGEVVQEMITATTERALKLPSFAGPYLDTEAIRKWARQNLTEEKANDQLTWSDFKPVLSSSVVAQLQGIVVRRHTESEQAPQRLRGLPSPFYHSLLREERIREFLADIFGREITELELSAHEFVRDLQFAFQLSYGCALVATWGIEVIYLLRKTFASDDLGAAWIRKWQEIPGWVESFGDRMAFVF